MKLIKIQNEKFVWTVTKPNSTQAEQALNKIKKDGYRGRIIFDNQRYHVCRSMHKRHRLGLQRRVRM